MYFFMIFEYFVFSTVYIIYLVGCTLSSFTLAQRRNSYWRLHTYVIISQFTVNPCYRELPDWTHAYADSSIIWHGLYNYEHTVEHSLQHNWGNFNELFVVK